MATSTTIPLGNEQLPSGLYTWIDENGTRVISEFPRPSAPKGADAEVVSNKAKGVIHTMEVVKSKRTGESTQIPMINGKMDPAFKEKQRKETQERIYKGFQKRVAAEAKAMEAAELAEIERLKIGNNYGISGEVGCEPEFPGAPEKKYEVGIGKPGSKDPGNVTVFNPGFKIPFTPGAAGCKISLKVEANAPNLYEGATGDAKNAQTARDVSEKAKEMKGEYDAAYEKAQTALRNKVPPQQVSEQLATDLADLGRKWGKEAGTAALK